MKGNICIVSETGWAISNDAVLDIYKELVGEGSERRTEQFSGFEVNSSFGSVKAGEMVSVAFQAEDGSNVSYRGTIYKATESRMLIKVMDQLNEYKQIIERTLSWVQ